MSVATLARPNSIAAQIGGNQWLAGAPYRPVSTGGGQSPTFPAILSPFVQPLEKMLELLLGNPESIFQASRDWEQVAGNAADAGAQLNALSQTVASQQSGAAANMLSDGFSRASDCAQSMSSWTKVGSQALQMCVTVIETVRSLVEGALWTLFRFAETIRDLIFGSFPWELEKKAETLLSFAEDVERFVQVCEEAFNNALKAIRELVRLFTDLFHAMVPVHEEIESFMGSIVNMVPGGDPPPVSPGERQGPNGAIYNPSHTPYPGSDLRILGDYPLGYQHSYDLGASEMTTEELNAMFRDEFGHLFVPSRVGDNTQLNSQLTHVGQEIKTSLFGLAIPGVTAGNIVVQQIGTDGFVITAAEGHPEFPGEVAFRITNEDGRARLQVTGAYDDTILGKHDFGASVDTNPAYAAISDYSIWADMEGRIRDRLRYG